MPPQPISRARHANNPTSPRTPDSRTCRSRANDGSPPIARHSRANRAFLSRNRPTLRGLFKTLTERSVSRLVSDRESDPSQIGGYIMRRTAEFAAYVRGDVRVSPSAEHRGNATAQLGRATRRAAANNYRAGRRFPLPSPSPSSSSSPLQLRDKR